MSIYVYKGRTEKIIDGADQVVTDDGTQYPGAWDKSAIEGLQIVTETLQPDAATNHVYGYSVEMVDGVPVQVWDVAAKTPDELLLESNNATLVQIDTLERSSMIPRVIREFTLAQTVITAQAAGVDEPTLYAGNIGYRKLKDLNTQIEALRDSLQ